MPQFYETMLLAFNQETIRTITPLIHSSNTDRHTYKVWDKKKALLMKETATICIVRQEWRSGKPRTNAFIRLFFQLLKRLGCLASEMSLLIISECS
jgi:hypothetical protein